MRITAERVEFSHAARILCIDAAILRHLTCAGVIEGNQHLCDLEHASEIVARIRRAQERGAGLPIHVTDGAEKFGFERRSIYNWIKSGWVQVLEPEPCIQVDEGDLWVAQELSTLLGARQGRPIFPPAKRRPRAHRKPAPEGAAPSV